MIPAGYVSISKESIYIPAALGINYIWADGYAVAGDSVVIFEAARGQARSKLVAVGNAAILHHKKWFKGLELPQAGYYPAETIDDVLIINLTAKFSPSLSAL